jgi:hypothetical protein
MNKFEEEFKTLLDTMVDGFTRETMEENKEIVIKIQQIYEADPDRFFDVIELAQHKFNTIIVQIINAPKQKNIYIVGHIISGLYEHFINKLMCAREGSAYSSDKSRFITHCTLKALKENQNISLFRDYSQCEQIKEDKERQAYWSPKTIIDTNEAMELFWKWYLLKTDI